MTRHSKRHADAHSVTASGLNRYNAADYAGYSHPPIITLGFDGVAGYGRYMAGDTTSDGVDQSLDDWGGHEHGIYDYHYHSEIRCTNGRDRRAG